MPNAVLDLVQAADSRYAGCVKWGTPVPETGGGIYMIATTDDPAASDVDTELLFDIKAADHLIQTRTGLKVDGAQVSADELMRRVAQFWLPDEPVVYIGKAGDLKRRVNQYYSTPLGARSPHAGGWLLKLLANLDHLHVHWATAPMPGLAEQTALAAFVKGVSTNSRKSLLDEVHPYPFANLEGPSGRKRHGVTGARAPLDANLRTRSSTRSPEANYPREDNQVSENQSKGTTQPVTASDLAAGRIRIPRSSKHLFPSERSDIQVSLRGTPISVRWDPRHGPPERSGTIGIGKANLASSLVLPDEVLGVTRDRGVIVIA